MAPSKPRVGGASVVGFVEVLMNKFLINLLQIVRLFNLNFFCFPG